MLQEKNIPLKLPPLKRNPSRWYLCNQPQRRPSSHLFLFSGSICLQQDQRATSEPCHPPDSRRSTTRRTRLSARPHPCFHSRHVRRHASCVITHSRQLLTKTLFTNPPVFTRSSSKVDFSNLVCSIFFHSGGFCKCSKTCVYNIEEENEARK